MKRSFEDLSKEFADVGSAISSARYDKQMLVETVAEMQLGRISLRQAINQTGGAYKTKESILHARSTAVEKYDLLVKRYNEIAHELTLVKG